MPMPPYLRFPENESIQQRIWGLRPRNPTCGKISLETGAKIFAWGNIIFYGISSAFFAVAALMLIAAFSSQPSHQDLLNGLKLSSIKGQQAEDWIEKMHIRQSHSFLIVVCLVGLTIACSLLRLSWMLKKAIIERDVPNLKKVFLIMVFLNLFFLLFFDIESEIVWTPAIIFDIVLMLFEIFGLIFTYSYIVSLINPDNSQNEDLNRIQFSP